METAIEPQEQELKQEALTVTQKAALVKITDQLTYNDASVLLLENIIPFRRRWTDYWYGSDNAPGPIKLAYRSYKSLLDKFNEGMAPLELAESQVKLAIGAWDDEQKRVEAERQRKAQEKAEADAREEQLNAAIVAEQSGASKDEVQDIFNAPVAAVAAPIVPAYQRASGISTRELWKCEVTDIKKLCLAVAKGQASVEYVLPNMTALNARARADKQTLNIPGCKAKKDSSVSGRTK